MSRLISDILDAKEPEFSHLIGEWERIAGRPGVDVRLAGELSRAVREVVEALGLDVRDTTNKELYFALLKKGREDNQKLANLLLIEESDNPSVVANKVVHFVSAFVNDRRAWVMKQSVARKLLKDNPPKKLLKALGYRSIDSVIKRESPAVLITLGAMVDPAYKKKLLAQYKKLQASDFDPRQIEAVSLSSDKVAKLSKAGYKIDNLILPSYDQGVLIVVLPQKRSNGDVLLFLSALLEGVRSVLMYSSYFKTLSLRPKFGEKFSYTIEFGLSSSSKHLVATGWPSLHRLIDRSPSSFPLQMQPHIHQDDLALPNIGYFSDALPELAFWDRHQYVVKKDSSGVTSCNLLDVMINDFNDLDYIEGISWYGQGKLWDELFSRYLAHDPVSNIVLKLD